MSNKCDIPENVTPCIRTHSLYEPQDKGSKKQTETSVKDKIIIKQEEQNIKFEAEDEEESVVIVVSTEGDAEITHYTQIETHQTLQHIIEDDNNDFNIENKEVHHYT